MAMRSLEEVRALYGADVREYDFGDGGAVIDRTQLTRLVQLKDEELLSLATDGKLSEWVFYGETGRLPMDTCTSMGIRLLATAELIGRGLPEPAPWADPASRPTVFSRFDISEALLVLTGARQREQRDGPGERFLVGGRVRDPISAAGRDQGCPRDGKS
jgi:hypothetical protein